jgi:hypothetical protein
MIRVAALTQVGRYDERYPIASDYEIFFRLTNYFETANLQEVLIHKKTIPTVCRSASGDVAPLQTARAAPAFRRAVVSLYLGVTTLLCYCPGYRAVENRRGLRVKYVMRKTQNY